MNRRDAIVVGAGPAGASAAQWLGEAGRRVLVLEQAALRRGKPCGGAFPQAVLGRYPFSYSGVKETCPTCRRFWHGGCLRTQRPLRTGSDRGGQDA